MNLHGERGSESRNSSQSAELLCSGVCKKSRRQLKNMAIRSYFCRLTRLSNQRLPFLRSTKKPLNQQGLEFVWREPWINTCHQYLATTAPAPPKW